MIVLEGLGLWCLNPTTILDTTLTEPDSTRTLFSYYFPQYWLFHNLILLLMYWSLINIASLLLYGCLRGRDRMLVGFITTYAIICNQCLSPQKLWIRIPLMAMCTRCNIMWWSLSVTYDRAVVFSWYYIQHYVIKFVSDLRQVGGFLRVLLFPPPIKLTATI